MRWAFELRVGGRGAEGIEGRGVEGIDGARLRLTRSAAAFTASFLHSVSSYCLGGGVDLLKRRSDIAWHPRRFVGSVHGKDARPFSPPLL
jgi:hypothetical protein